MKVYVNNRGEIKDVNINSRNDPSLTEIEVIDGTFEGWTDAKICCYKVTVDNGHIAMMTPYVDSRLIDHIDQLGSINMLKTAYIADTEAIFTNVKNGNLSVFAKDTEGKYPLCTAERSGDTVKVSFDPLENVTEITLSIS